MGVWLRGRNGMLDAARGAATATATARRRRDDGETRRRDTTADLRRDGTCGARCGARCGAGLLRGAARPCGSVRPSPSRRLSRRVVFAVVVVVVVVVAAAAAAVAIAAVRPCRSREPGRVSQARTRSLLLVGTGTRMIPTCRKLTRQEILQRCRGGRRSPWGAPR
jgi:hypothetical protein